MTQYNTLNAKLPNSQLIRLKSAIKNGTKLTLNPSSMLSEILMLKIIFHTNYY